MCVLFIGIPFGHGMRVRANQINWISPSGELLNWIQLLNMFINAMQIGNCNLEPTVYGIRFLIFCRIKQIRCYLFIASPEEIFNIRTYSEQPRCGNRLNVSHQLTLIE